MKRTKESRLYAREQGGQVRYYADLRDLGGGRVALVAPGEKLATTDLDVAAELAAARVKGLEAGRRSRGLLGVRDDVGLEAFAREHLLAKAKAGKVTERWLLTTERHLERAIAHFGKDRSLAAIGVADVRAWLTALQAGGLTGGTVRHHLNSLSNLYRRAGAEAHVPPGFNPAAAIMEKPSAARREARWLEVADASLLLEAARLYRPARPDMAFPNAYELLATFLLTGGRRSEVLGLEVGDLDFTRKTVTFRPNAWRRLKSSTSARVVPMWPQLEAILDAAQDAAPDRLLFPSTCARRGRGESEPPHMLAEPRKLLDAIAERGGWKAGEIRTKMFRHTYCAARLQTLDRGAPVATYTVAKELGHGGTSLVERVYGHLGQVRHRSKAVEYRVEQHTRALKGRLAAVRAGAL